MKQKINLSDVRWAYSNDGVLMMPIIVNNECTRYKDLTTNNIYHNLRKTEGSFVMNSTLRDAVAEAFQLTPEEITIDTSTEMLLSHGRGLFPYLTSSLLKKFGNFVSGSTRNEEYWYAQEFCQKTALSQGEYIKLAKTLKKEVSRKSTEQEKRKISTIEYQEENFSF